MTVVRGATQAQIEEAKTACEAAWAAHPEATWGWCIHHEIECEPLREPIHERIHYILSSKPPSEQITRLNNMRPVLSPLPEKLLKAGAEYDKAGAEYDKAWAEYDKAQAEYSKATAEYYKARAESSKAQAEFDKAQAEYYKAWAEFDKAQAEYNKACAEYYKARDEFSVEITPLHNSDVPNNTWDGKSIF